MDIKVMTFSRNEQTSGGREFLGYCQVLIPAHHIQKILTLKSPGVRERWSNGNLHLSVGVVRGENGELRPQLPGSSLECDSRVWVDVIVLSRSGQTLLAEAIHQYLSDLPEDYKPTCYQSNAA